MNKKNTNFERELPKGYREAFHINAKDKGTALVLSIVALTITIAVFAVMMIPVFKSGIDLSNVAPEYFFLFYGIFVISMVIYIILHELTHGVVYKLMTREKLTFGITPAAAFCGVPGIYTYRRCALAALVAPLITFTAVLIPIIIFFSMTMPLYYIGFSFIFAMHLGGCVGDGYLTYLLLTKYKKDDVLIRDTGPEQFIYVRKKK